MKTIATAIIGLTLCASAQAEFLTGNDLLSRLQSSDVAIRMTGLGYVMGVFDASQGAAHCAPNDAGITAGQVRDITTLWLERNPAQRHETADRLVVNMLSQLWPCQRRNSL